MPMSKDDKDEILLRLTTAEQKTRKLFERDSESYDTYSGMAIAQMWPAVTAGYSGLEQTLKYLIADRRGMTVEELLLELRKNGENAHDLGMLFGKLDRGAAATIRDYYGTLQSLYFFLPGAAGKFLNNISTSFGEKGGRATIVGVMRWFSRTKTAQQQPGSIAGPLEYLPSNSEETPAGQTGIENARPSGMDMVPAPSA